MSDADRCSACGGALDPDTGSCHRCILELALESTAHLADSPTPLAPPEKVGPYQVMDKLGEGGMGVVYLAEQREPIRRQVALKLIKLGMDTREVIARFESERQALALMNHPNVAKVLDAGATDEGRPYFVMEYVAGEAITSYCDTHRFSTRQRLELFIDVCRGVQHAHQKGLLHRDIKPSNVLVATENEKPIPRIIDFGVAKATSRRLTEKTVFTRLGQMIGTPEYMSPEQAKMTGVDIDTRTDVYSLGVLLYELLVGALPFELHRLREAGFAEICRKIREELPSKPSTRVSSLGEASGEVASLRRTEPLLLQKSLDGDLDWITMKALEKERDRRYESPAHLAADIERHIGHEPVLAGPPGLAYRSRKFVRRHRAGVVVGCVLFAGVTLGLAGLSIGVVKARRAEARAVRQADLKTRVADFLKDLFTVSNPGKSRGETITARELLDDAAKKIEDAGVDPQTRAELMETMGDVYRRLGLYDRAEPLLDQASTAMTGLLGEDHPDRLEAVHLLTVLYRKQARFDEAEPIVLEVLERRKSILGPDHKDTLESMAQLALIYFQQGRFDEAEPVYLEVLEGQKRLNGIDDPRTLSTMNNLATLYQRQSRFDEAEALHLDTLERRTAVLGDDSPDTLYSRNNLATVYWYQGRFDESERFYREVVTIGRRVFGDEHPTTLKAMNNLAMLLTSRKRYDDAEALHVTVLAARRRTLGDAHAGTLSSIENLGIVYLEQGQYAKATALLAEARDSRRRVLGPEHPSTLRSMHNFGELLQKQKRWNEAEGMYDETLEAEKRVLGEEHMLTLHTKHNLAGIYRSTGRSDAAESLYVETLATRERVLGPEHPDTAQTRESLAELYRMSGRMDDAERLATER